MPPRSGLVSLARYRGGLVLHHAGGDFRALPWEAIEGYEYTPSRLEHRGNLRIEHFARVLILPYDRETPYVVTKLAGGYEPGLAEAIRAGLMPRHTAPLHERFEEDGHVVLGKALAVVPGGLLIDPANNPGTDPLPWSDVEEVAAGTDHQLRITARTELHLGGRNAYFTFSDAHLVAAFVQETRARLLPERRSE
ncbi:hypothetical protein [Kitasatospora brasiliensis]|uniref:hypothetical protein n=1 Tax=Kitasatospora brasiliensis TaxID=3058040 RepID=UPI002930C055|nr:hypothetical protein [Kitasatospora sp. K002]